MTFANATVQLKICKLASDPAVTAPYRFTVVGTHDPTFPAPITRSVTVRPGQCQVVPGQRHHRVARRHESRSLGGRRRRDGGDRDLGHSG